MAKRDKAVIEKLNEHFDTVKFSNKTGEYIIRSMGGSPEKLAEAIKHWVPEATVTKMWERYAPWPKDSYWEVRFILKETV